jgi:hypothetical protein
MKNVAKFNTIRLNVLAAWLILLFGSCESFNFNKNAPSKNILIDQEIEVASQSIPASGGILTVDDATSTINGMTIKVLANSYSSPKTFTITTADIADHKLGDYFNPITPLIQIDNGGGYSATPMEVTIPITLPEGHFAMGFIYDEMTGRLEGMPVLKLSSNSITVTTMHFMSSSAISNEIEKSAPVARNASVNMVIASIAESAMKNQTIISSGFKPGVDDWEYVNYGSYISPGGHCAGQSMTAMWYYYEKKLAGETSLYHAFDKNNNKEKPAFQWQDNPRGYRFSSVIQEDFNFNGWINNLQIQSFIPSLVFKAFAASMLITGEPQLVLIRNSQGKGGHAMIVYKVNFNEGKLYIADPNYPNNRKHDTGVESIRTIDLVNGVLKAYETGLSAGANSITMDQIGYFAKTTYINWGQIGKRWAEFTNGTIGTVAPNAFPAYKIIVKGDVDTELKNKQSFEKDTLKLVVESPTAELSYSVNGKKLIGHYVFDEQGNKVNIWKGSGLNHVALKPGLNRLGFYIYGFREGHKVPNTNNYSEQFVDYQWFDVYYSKLKIDPNPIAGEPKTDIKITARSGGTAPRDAKYVWDFGDGSKAVTVKNDSTVIHKFLKKGDFEVNVKLYDNATGTLVGEALAEANIRDGILGRLQKCKWVGLVFSADIKSNNEIISFSSVDVDNEPPFQSTVKCPLVWNGTKFSSNYAYSYSTLDGTKITYSGVIQGETSAEGLVVKTISGTYDATYSTGDVWSKKLAFSDVPYDPTYQYDEYNPRFILEGSKSQTHVSTVKCTWNSKDSDGKAFSLTITGVDYASTRKQPYMHVSFY